MRRTIAVSRPLRDALSREGLVSFDPPSVKIAPVCNPTDGSSVMSVQVSPLRQRMIDDMTIRNMSPLTQKAYVRAVKNFSFHFRRSPDKLTFEDVRAYQLHLVSRGLEATTINQIMCALRFLYGTTLGKKDASEEIKLARQSDPLPIALSRHRNRAVLEGCARSSMADGPRYNLCRRLARIGSGGTYDQRHR